MKKKIIGRFFVHNNLEIQAYLKQKYAQELFKEIVVYDYEINKQNTVECIGINFEDEELPVKVLKSILKNNGIPIKRKSRLKRQTYFYMSDDQ